MRKTFGLISTIIFACILCFAGCGDIYANMKITTDCEDNQLEMILDTADQSSYTKTFTATLTGFSDTMDRELGVKFSPSGIATASLVSEEDGVNTISVTAINAGTTTMTVYSMETSKVVSEPITLNVILPVQSINAKNVNPSVQTGQSLNLVTDNLVSFLPLTTNQRDITYYIAPGYELNGVSISGSTITATESAQTGIVKLIAISNTVTDDMTTEEKANLTCEIYVMVYNEFSASDIILTNVADREDIDSLTMATASDEINTCNFIVKASTGNISYKVLVTTTNSNIAQVVAEENDFLISAFSVGNVNMLVTVTLYDEDTEKEFVAVTKSVEVEVIQIAYSVQFTTKTITTPTDQNIDINVLDEDATSKGTEVRVKVQPETAKSRQYSISVYNVDGSTDNLGSKLSSIRVYHYVNGVRQLVTLEEQETDISEALLDNDTSFFVCFTGANILNYFVLAVSANSSDDTIPNVVNYVTCYITAGVTSISLNINGNAVTNNQIMLGITDELKTSLVKINYTTKGGTSVGAQTFSYAFDDNGDEIFEESEIARATKTTDFTQFNLTSLSEGNTVLRISSNQDENGYYADYNVSVVVEPMEANLDVDNTVAMSSGGKIALTHYNNDEVQNGLSDFGLQDIYLSLYTEIGICLDVLPSNSSISNLNVVSNNTNAVVVEGAKIRAVGVNIGDSTATTITATFDYWVYDSVTGWSKQSGIREFDVYVFVPVKSVAWAGSGYIDTNLFLYDTGSLSYTDLSAGTANLVINIKSPGTETATFRRIYFENTESTTYYDTNYLTVTDVGDNRTFTITARLQEGETSATTTLYMSVIEPGAVYTCSCTVHISKPQQVTSITTDADNDELYLEYGGLINRNKDDFNISTLPNSVYNNNTICYIANADNINGTITPTGQWNDASTTSGVNAILNIVDNNVSVTAIASGYAIIRIVPADIINNINTFDPDDASVYKDVLITIADGVATPFRIYNANDLSALSQSQSISALSKSYVLMQTIDMTNKAWTPIGSGTDDGFTGSFISNGYDSTGAMYSILGLGLTTYKDGNEYYTGMFSKLTGAEVSGLQIKINVTASASAFSLSGYKNNSIGYFGGLAGVIEDSTINDISVSLQNSTFSIGLTAGVGSGLYFGGLAGLILNSSNTSEITNISIILNVILQQDGTSSLFIGGIAGDLGDNLTNENGTSSVDFQLTYNDSLMNGNTIGGIGGIAGVLESGKAITNYYSTGRIDAEALIFVGGIVGCNGGILSGDETSMRVFGNISVGGLVGYNLSTGQISNCVVESYDSDTMSAEDIYAVFGNTYVGGLVGSSMGGSITYSYFLSYIRSANRSMTNLANYGNEITDQTGSFYGDIVGCNYVGGIVGYATNTNVSNSFSKGQINAYKESGNNFVGGIFGVLTNTNTSDIAITNCFANCIIYAGSMTESTTTAGEIAGYIVTYTSSKINLSHIYARVVLSVYSTSFEVKTVVTRKYGNSTITSDIVEGNNIYFYGTVGTNVITDLANFNDTYLTTFDIGSKQGDGSYLSVWIDSLSTAGYNDNSLILVNSTADGMLYKKSIQSIAVSQLNTASMEIGQILPTYFQRNNGLVVVLDNLWNSQNNSFDELTLTDLIELTVAPIMNEDEWQLNVISSDNSILSINKNNKNLIGAKLQFVGTGVVNLTIQSMQDLTAKVTIEINVIAGLNSFTLEDKNGDDITLDNYTLNVKLNNSVSITPIVHQNTSLANSVYVQYSCNASDLIYDNEGVNSQYFLFNGVDWTGSDPLSVSIPSNVASHSIIGLAKTSGAVTVSVVPYVILSFGGATEIFAIDGSTIGAGVTIGDLSTSFDLRVYNGITSATLDTSSMSIYSSDSYLLNLNYTSDLPESVECEVSYSDSYDNASVGKRFEDILSYTNNTQNGLVNFYFEIPEDTEEVADLLESNRYLTEDITYTMTITLKDTEINQIFNSYTFTITFKPTPVKQIRTTFYQNGEVGLDADDIPNTQISPGRKALMVVNVADYYADYDYIEISSTTDSVSGDSVSLSQLADRGAIGSNGNTARYQTIDGGSLYDGNKLLAQPVTCQTADEYGVVNSTYNGTLYISAIIGSDVEENTIFTLTLRAIKNGSTSEPCTVTLQLTSCFAPKVTLTTNNEVNEQILVARGTVVNFDLTGVVLNTKIDIIANYTGDDGDTLTQCKFINNSNSFTYRSETDTKQSVNEIVSFYIGIEASPPSGIIELTIKFTDLSTNNVTITSTYAVYYIYVVNYIITDVYMEGMTNGVLNINPTSYTLFRLVWEMQEPSVDEFQDIFDISAGASILGLFEISVSNIHEQFDNDLQYINTLGTSANSIYGNDSIWSVYLSGVYRSIMAGVSYTNFSLEEQQLENDECAYYYAKGLKITSGISLKAMYNLFYVRSDQSGLSDWNGYWQMEVDQHTARTTLLTLGVDYDFTMNVVNSSSDDKPYTVSTASDLINMEAGSIYMLTNNITLTNWVPLDTAITSLDGNGYTITINSFATNTDSTGTYNIGLFGTVDSGTVLKNIIIDLSNIAFVDAREHSTVNFGYLAGKNNGTIYNCDIIVSADETTWYSNTADKQNSFLSYVPQFGQDVYSSWESTTNGITKANATTFILTSTTVGTTAVTTFVGGLVGYNTGAISNSRVGSKEEVGYQDSIHNIGNQGVQGVNIIANGNVAGLAGYNSGVISACLYANGYVVNSQNNAKTSKTAGLVAIQSITGEINTSYVEGIQTYSNGKFVLPTNANNIRYSSGGIKSYGTIGGLVHSNAGIIENCYVNTTITGSSGIGGFVYSNSGKITDSYSLATIKENSRTSGSFVGISTEIEVQNSGTVTDCYYVTQTDVIFNENEPATALSMAQFLNSAGKYLQGFAFTITTYSTESTPDTIWKLVDLGNNIYLPTLVETNNIAQSYRGIYAGADADDYTRPGDCVLGSSVNPIIIDSVTKYNNVFNNDTINYTDKYIRIVCNLDFNNNSTTYSMKKTFAGYLQGNGMTISGINYSSQSDSSQNLGLFAKITNGYVVNLGISLDTEITAGLTSRVGALAGTIGDDTNSKIVIVQNVKVSGTTGAKVQGLNLVGGLAGFVVGKTIIQNVTSSIDVYATYQTASNRTVTYYAGQNSTASISTMSYAGGVIGAINLYNPVISNENVYDYESDATIKNCIVKLDVDILAESSGGIVGDLYNGGISRCKVIVDESYSPKIRASNFAGGLVGENRGIISQSFVAQDLSVQKASDQSITASSNSQNFLGYLGLFQSDETTVAIGGLVGLNRGGTIINSYAREAVVSTNALFAGGLIGFAVTSNISADTLLGNIKKDIDSVLDYDFADSVLYYNTINGTVTVDDYAGSVTKSYTTSPVYATTSTGGLIGVLAGSFMSCSGDTSPNDMAINNYPETTTYNTTANIANDNIYVGNLIGYININLQRALIDNTSTALSMAGFVIGATSNTTYAEASCYASNGVVDADIGAIKQNAGSNYIKFTQVNTVASLTFVNVATSISINCFDGLDASGETWTIDINKTGAIFPVLSFGGTRSIIQISNAEEFLTLVGKSSSAYYQVINDITITDSDWYTYIGQYNKGTMATSTDRYLSGQLYGMVVDGNITRPATITVALTNANDNLANFESLFGFTKNLTIMDMNFRFDFASYSNSMTDFAYLVINGTNTTFRNVSVYNGSGGALYITLNNVQNFGVFVATGEGCSFNNVATSINLIGNYSSATANENNIGGLFGNISSSVRIAGATQVATSINITSTSPNTDKFNVGGMGGNVSDLFAIEASYVGLSDGNATGIISINVNNTVNAGGIIGKNGGNGYSKISSLLSNVNLVVTAQSNCNESYVGGLVGQVADVNINSAISNGTITLSKVDTGGAFYVGGIAGKIINTGIMLPSVNLISGRVVDIANSYGDINITLNTGICYAGSIFGYCAYQMSTAPSSTTKNVFTALSGQGDLTITSLGTVYAGGLIGYLTQIFGSTETYNNTSLRLSSSISLGDITINNASSIFAGGLAGFSGMAIYNCMSNAQIYVVSTDTPNTVFVGGAVGNLCCYLNGCLVLTSVTVQSNQNLENVSFGAIIGTKGTYGRIISIIYCPELVGLYDASALDVSLDELQDWQNIIALSSSLWGTDWSDSTNTAIVHPLAISDSLLANDTRMYITTISNSTDLMTVLGDLGAYNNATILLNFDTVSMGIFDNNITLTGIRRLLGKSSTTVISFANSLVIDIASDDNAFFDIIDKGVVVSNIKIDISNITINSAGSGANIAVFVAKNYGILFNCSVGSVPTVSSSTNDLDTFANNMTENQGYGTGDTNIRYTNSYEYNKYITKDLTTLVYKGGSAINISALCAKNYGSISSCYTYADIVMNNGVLSSVGEIVATSSNSAVLNCFAFGRITYVTTVNTDSVGGLVGNATRSLLKDSVSNVNIYLASNTDTTVISNVGLGVGVSTASKINGLIVNKDISMAHSLNKFNTNYDLAINTYDGMSTTTTTKTFVSKINVQTETWDFDFTNVWTQDYTKNYGMPYLIIMSDIVADTGSGKSNNPFQIAEGIQFSRLSATDGIRAVLSRDIVYSGKDYTTRADVKSTLDGKGHSIYVVKYNSYTLSGIKYVGLFNNLTISADIKNIVVVCNAISTNYTGTLVFGGLSATCSSSKVANIGLFSIKNSGISGINYTGVTSSSKFGGLFGINNGTNITQCFADVDISVNNGNVGGLVGTQFNSATSDVSISKVFVISNLTSTSGFCGGLIGSIEVANGAINAIRLSNSYYYEYNTPVSFSSAKYVGQNNSVTFSKLSCYFVYLDVSTSTLELTSSTGEVRTDVTSEFRYGEYFDAYDVWDCTGNAHIGQTTLPYLIGVTPLNCRDLG